MTERPILSSMTRISDLARVPFQVESRSRDGWAMGDSVAGEIVGDPSPWRVELVTGRMVELSEGDLIVGTSMSAGKTAAARTVIRRLVGAGRTVAAAKVTGAGRFRDILTMGDSGADPIFDFVDEGLPSTVCSAEEYRPALEGLLTRIEGAARDAAVVEVGASPLEPYNGDLAAKALAPAVRMTILCASDPYAVVGLMEAFGATPDLVTGIASNTRAGVELVERLSGVPCLNVRNAEALPELDRRLEAALGPWADPPR